MNLKTTSIFWLKSIKPNITNIISKNCLKLYSLVSTFAVVSIISSNPASIAGEYKTTNTIIYASADVEIDQHINYSSRNLGSNTALRIRRRDPKFKKPVPSPQSYGLIKWDLSEIPSTDIITNVTLQIQQADAAVGTTDIYIIDKGNWEELKVTWNSWTKTDKKETFLGKMQNVPITKGVTVFKNPKLTALVQGWVNHSHPNLGLLFKWGGKAGEGDTYLSREHKGKFIKPRLIISHVSSKTASEKAAVNQYRSTFKPQTVIKGYSGQVAAVMDLDYDLICYMHTPELLKKKAELLAACGFKRIYIVAPPPGDPDYVINSYPNRKGVFLNQSREALGNDPLRYAVKYCKEAGMEVFVQFKPYEGGGSFTVPDGFEPPGKRNWIKTLGGRAVGVDPFILKHPEMRPKRKDIDNRLSLPADSIEMVFVLNEILGRKGLKITDGVMEIAQRPGYPALASSAVKEYPAKNFLLYVSKDNGKYEPYTGALIVSERIERRLIRNANDELLFPEAVLCRVIKLSGFELKSPYFAVKFDGDSKAFRTIPYSSSCFKAYSGKQELPITVSPKERNGLITGKYGFTANGFEFNELGPYYWNAGWKTKCLFGFARGRAQYQRGTFSEAYPEVRAHWMKQIQRFIELGCDGVDIRLMCHSAGITDFVNYSFNPPIVKEYKKRYGLDITKHKPDPVKMMKLRGDFFLEFVREAAELLHKNNLKLQMQTHDYQEHPTLDPTFPNAGFWAATQVIPDWRQVITIADEISIKDYNWGNYDPFNAGRIKNAVSSMGKPLWIHCYMQQGHDLNKNFLSSVEKDKRVTGLMLYEVVYRPGNVKDGMIEITPDRKVRLAPGSPFHSMLVNPHQISSDK